MPFSSTGWQSTVSVRCCICWNGRFFSSEYGFEYGSAHDSHLELLYDSWGSHDALGLESEHGLVALQHSL